MDKTILAEVSRQMIERYSDRYRKLGYDVQTLGWGTREQQEYRFAQTLATDPITADTSVLDIGCGFGDYLSFLDTQGKTPARYTGWDINPDLVNEAKAKWNGRADAIFETVDMVAMTAPRAVADIAVMLGVLNLNLRDKVDNYEYSFELIKKAFDSCKKMLIVDFLSTNITASYPKEGFVFYHDPVVMLKYALQLSEDVVLKHDYAPIPQKEFMLFISK